MKNKLLAARSPVLYSLLVLGILVVVGAGLQIYTLSELHDLQDQEISVKRHATLLNDIQADLLAAESSQRGYVVTQNPAYLVPYQQKIPTLRQSIQKLPGIQVSATQHQNYLQIQQFANEKLAEMQSVIDTYNHDGVEAAQAQIQQNIGKQLMDKVQAVIAKAKRRQDDALNLQTSRTTHDLDRTQVLTPILVALILFMAVLTAYLSRQSVNRERSLEQAKSEFIDIAAHQLRTPATSVKQYLGLLLGGYLGKLTKQQRDALQTATTSNDQELNIVEDILRVARADGGNITLHPQPTNLDKLLKSVAATYKTVLKDRKQKIELQLPKRAVSANIDPTYIRIVVENLIDNASKYSADSTAIVLRLTRSRGVAFIGVEDHGVGIRTRDQPKLFQKFSRIENSRSASVSGTGLGLYWVRKIVELHEGSVKVESKQNKGSKFIVQLPLQGPAA